MENTAATTDRAILLVDLENLCGPESKVSTVRKRINQLRRFANLAATDQLVIAGAQQLLFSAAIVEPGARLLASSPGVADSADLALCGAADEIIEANARGAGYTRVIIGSGDHIFSGVARRLRAIGVTVEVAGRAGCTSHSLARNADRSGVLPAGVGRRRRPSRPRGAVGQRQMVPALA